MTIPLVLLQVRRSFTCLISFIYFTQPTVVLCMIHNISKHLIILSWPRNSMPSQPKRKVQQLVHKLSPSLPIQNKLVSVHIYTHAIYLFYQFKKNPVIYSQVSQLLSFFFIIFFFNFLCVLHISSSSALFYFMTLPKQDEKALSPCNIYVSIPIFLERRMLEIQQLAFHGSGWARWYHFPARRDMMELTCLVNACIKFPK